MNNQQKLTLSKFTSTFALYRNKSLAEILKILKETTNFQLKHDLIIILIDLLRESFTKTSNPQFQVDLFTFTDHICENSLSCFIQDQDKSLKLISMRLIIILSHIPSFFNRLFTAHSLHKSISNSLKSRDSKAELSLVMEFVRLVVELYPNTLNEIYFYSLNNFIQHIDYELNLVGVETLLEMVYAQPILAAKCGSLVKLLRYIADMAPNLSVIEAIMTTIFKVLAREETRSVCVVRNFFCDLITQFFYHESNMNVVSIDGNCVSKQEPSATSKSLADKLEACSCALIFTLTNFTGLSIFSNGGDMEYLVSSFQSPNIKYLFRIFYETFEIRDVNFIDIDTQFSLEKELLHAYASTTNIQKLYDVKLTDIHRAILLNHLVNAGIFKALVELYFKLFQNKKESVYCMRLMSELYSRLDCYKNKKELKLMINLKSNEEAFNEIEQAIRNVSQKYDSNIVFQIESEIFSNLNQTLCNTFTAYMPKFFFKQLFSQKSVKNGMTLNSVSDTNNNLGFIEKNSLKNKLKSLNKCINDQIDNILHLPKNQRWIELVKLFENYLNNDPPIEEISFEEMSQQIREKIKKSFGPNDDNLFTFLKNKSSIYNDTIVECIISCGVCLLNYLMEQLGYQDNSFLDLFLLNIKAMLIQHIENSQANSYFISIFYLIGHLSSQTIGEELLVKHGIIEFLLKYVDTCKNYKILKYLLSCLNFNTSKSSRDIFIRCSNINKSRNKHEYGLFKGFLFYILSLWSQQIDTHTAIEFFQVLFHCLNDSHQFLKESCINLLDECLHKNQEFIDLLEVKKLVPFDMLFRIHKTERDSVSWCVINRFLNSSQYFTQFVKDGMLELWLNEWIDSNMDLKYSKLIENRLYYAFSLQNSFNYSKHLFQNKFGDYLAFGMSELTANYMNFYDNSDSTSDEDDDKNGEMHDINEREIELYSKVNIFYGSTCSSIIPTNRMPIHLYKILAENDFKSNVRLNQLIKSYTNYFEEETVSDTQLLKAALWSIASVANSKTGIGWLQIHEFDLLERIREISCTNRDMQVRGVALFCISQFQTI